MGEDYEPELPEEFDSVLDVQEKPLKYVSSPPYDILATNRRLIVSRRHKKEGISALSYRGISSAEHKRLMNLKLLVIFAVLAGISAALLFLPQSEQVMRGLTGALRDSLNFSPPSTPKEMAFNIGALFGLLSLATLFPFFGSASYRLVVYYTDKGSLNVPLKMGGDAMELMSVLHEQIKGSAGASTEQIEAIVEEKIGSLLEVRMQMEKELLSLIKEKAAAAKTPEQQKEVKELFEKSVIRMEDQDKKIEESIASSGLSKEDIFRKYRIKPPKEAFIDALIKEGIVDNFTM